MEHQLSFGEFLQKRRSAIMRQRDLADRIGITVSYLCDVENERRDPPRYDLLIQIADVLGLSGIDREMFFDLAGKGRNEVSPDLPEYIMQSSVSDSVRLALRTAKKTNASVEDWLEFVQRMKDKNQTA